MTHEFTATHLESLLAVLDNGSYGCAGIQCILESEIGGRGHCQFCEHIEPTLSEAIWNELHRTGEFDLPPFLDKSGMEIPGVVADAYLANTPANALSAVLEACASSGFAYQADSDFWQYVAILAENYTPTPQNRGRLMN